MSQPIEKITLMAYIDGYNLFYGLLKNKPERKWLNLSKMVKMLFPHRDVIAVKYFTAAVSKDAQRVERQQLYWTALKSAGVQIIEGRLETRRKDCGVKECCHKGLRTYDVPVEKMTDVNMALHIVTDARLRKPGAICIISGDTDLMPALDVVRRDFPCERSVIIPCSEAMLKFRRIDQYTLHGWNTKRLPETIIEDSQFSDNIDTGGGIRVACPYNWTRKPTHQSRSQGS
jgi:hypothetical protein